jgi:hypothetical protein
VVEVAEYRLIQELVAHAAVEGLADAVLHRLARRDEVPGDLCGLRPGEHGVGGELRAVIGDDQLRPAAASDDGVEFARHAPPRDRGVRDRGKAFLGHIVDDVEDAEAPARAKLIVNKVD